MSDSSSSSSSSSSVGNDDNLHIDDMDLFILAGKLAKQLADGAKTNSDRKKVLSQLAAFYQLKLVPMNTVSQGSNQILNAFTNVKISDNNKQVDKDKYVPTTKKGQPPPNPVKRDPEYIKMSSVHLDLQNKLRTLTKGTDEHTNVLGQVRKLEQDMAKFKQDRGRNVVAPAVTQGIVNTMASSAASAGDAKSQ